MVEKVGDLAEDLLKGRKKREGKMEEINRRLKDQEEEVKRAAGESESGK